MIPGPAVLRTAPAALVFVVAAVSDVLWGLYIRRASEGRAVSAATSGALLVVLGAVTVVSYTANLWLLVPILAGNWVGTYAIVRWDHRTRLSHGSP